MVERDEYTKEIVELLQQDWKEGLSLFDEILRTPGDVEARKKLRAIERKHRERKRPILRIPFNPGREQPVFDCERHLLRDPWDVECLFKLAELLRTEKAVARWIYEDIDELVREKADTRMWERLAEGYEGVDAWGKAGSIYRMLNAESPRPEYERKIALVESKGGTSVGPDSSFRDFIKDKEEARKLEESGKIPKSQNDYLQRAKEKEEELQTATTAQKKIHILAEIARDYLRGGDAGRARENYGEILKIDANNADAIEELLRMDMAAAGDKQKAIETGIAGYEKLLKLEPTNSEFSLQLGRLYMEAEDCHQAILSFQKAARHLNFKRRAKSELARCFFLLGLHAIAVKEYEEILAEGGIEEGEQMEATYALAECYCQMGDLKRAFELFGEVYRRHADFKDVRDRVFELNERLRPPSAPPGK